MHAIRERERERETEREREREREREERERSILYALLEQRDMTFSSLVIIIHKGKHSNDNKERQLMDLPTRKLEDRQKCICISNTLCRICIFSEHSYMNWGTALWTRMRMTDTQMNGCWQPITLCTSWAILYKPVQYYTVQDTIFVPWPKLLWQFCRVSYCTIKRERENKTIYELTCTHVVILLQIG